MENKERAIEPPGGARNIRHPQLTSARQLSGLINISNLGMLRKMHELAGGVKELLDVPSSGKNLHDEAGVVGKFRKSQQYSSRSAASLEIDALVEKRQRRGIGLFPSMPRGVGGNTSGVVLAEYVTRYIYVYLTRDKTTGTVLKVLRFREAEVRKHCQYMADKAIELHGDSDPGRRETAIFLQGSRTGTTE